MNEALKSNAVVVETVDTEFANEKVSGNGYCTGANGNCP